MNSIISRAYVGNSMAGVLREGDQVLVSAVPFGAVRVGDVVVFRGTAGEREIVHRVTARAGVGLRTQGDASMVSDPGLVLPDRYLGRVDMVVRGCAWLPVAGGRRGQWQARRNRIRRRLLGIPAWVVRPFRRRCGDELLVKLAAALPGVRHACYAAPDGTAIRKLIWNDQVLACQESDAARWHLRFCR